MKNYMFGDKKKKLTDSERSLISETVSIEGTINSSGAIDIAGLIKGPVISKEIIIRETGSVTGTIEGDREQRERHKTPNADTPPTRTRWRRHGMQRIQEWSTGMEYRNGVQGTQAR